MGQVRTSQMHTESGQEMTYHPDYNSQKPVTHAGPPQNDFLFKGVRVCYRCFHFMFFHSREGGCQAQKLSVSYPSLEPLLGPCYCSESVSDEARKELLRVGAVNGFDLAEGNTQAPVYLGKGPDMRVSLPRFNRNRASLGRFAEK